MYAMERIKADIRPAELAAQLRVAVWRAARRMRHVSDVEITPTLHAALRTVERQKPTITRTIRELVERGLIERLPDPIDGRVTWLQTTPEGTALLHAARRRTDVFLTQRLKALDPEERETLRKAAEILDKLAQGEAP